MARAIQINAGGSTTVAVTDTFTAGTALGALVAGMTKIRVHNTGANLAIMALTTAAGTAPQAAKEMSIGPGQVEYLERSGYSHIAAICPTATQTTSLNITPYADAAV